VLVAATLLVTTVSSYILVRRAVITTSHASSTSSPGHRPLLHRHPADITKAAFGRQLRLIADAGAYAGIAPIALYPDGRVSASSVRLTVGQIRVPALLDGQQVSGHEFSRWCTPHPVPVSRATRFTPVLVSPAGPRSGQRAPLLRAGGCHRLVIAALVASDLAAASPSAGSAVATTAASPPASWTPASR